MRKQLSNGDTVYVVASDRAPSIFNEDMWVGGLLGFVASGLFGGMGAVPGALIGGWLGKRRMNQELTEGHVVHPPSFWNKKIAKYAMIGLIVGAMLAGGLALAFSGPLTSYLASHVLAGVAMPMSDSIELLPAFIEGSALLGGLAAGVVSGIVGGIRGKREMAAEYEAAAVREPGEASVKQGRSANLERSPGQAVSPEIPQKSFTAVLDAERERVRQTPISASA